MPATCTGHSGSTGRPRRSVRESDDRLLLAHTVRHVGDILQDEDRGADALPCYEEALALYRADPRSDPLGLANVIRPLAILKESLGGTDQAAALWAEARELYRAAGIAAGVEEADARLGALS